MSNEDTTVTTAEPEQKLTAHATAKYVRMAPMKARRVIDLVRGKDTATALDILRFAPQSASEQITKILQSAIANAENNFNLDPRTLYISAAYADEGPTLKRFRPRAQGRAFRVNKRTSHITIEVTSRPDSATGRGRRNKGGAQ